jgi:predicted nuclease with TOPRIM domain
VLALGRVFKMGIMETLGYVKNGKYEEVIRERDSLRRSIAELEDDIKVLEADKKRLKEKVEFLKMAVPAIRKIKNIGPRTAEKLEESGIKDIIDLIESSPEKIEAATGLPKERTLKLIKKATNLIKKQA